MRVVRCNLSSSNSLTEFRLRMGWGWSLPLRPYGEAWRVRRRLTQSEFDAKQAARFRPQQAKACHGLLDAILDSPESWYEHLRQ